MRNNIKFFHFRGGIDYKKLSLLYKAMMGMLKFIISRKDSKKLTKDDKELLTTYGGKVDFTDKNIIIPLVNFTKGEKK